MKIVHFGSLKGLEEIYDHYVDRQINRGYVAGTFASCFLSTYKQARSFLSHDVTEATPPAFLDECENHNDALRRFKTILRTDEVDLKEVTFKMVFDPDRLSSQSGPDIGQRPFAKMASIFERLMNWFGAIAKG